MPISLPTRGHSFGLALVAALTTAFIVPTAGQSPATEKPSGQSPSTWQVPRTPDGKPDLRGVWANNNATPLERPLQFKGRALLTDAEVERIKKRAGELFDGSGDAAFGEEIFIAALSDREKYVADSFDKTTGNYNSFWLVERDFDNRTSLINDPADGRIPELTAGAKARVAAAMAARQRRGPADSYTDRSLSERCITFGFPDLLAGYNSYYQIVQSPEWVGIAAEKIHDTRLIPLDGRPHAPAALKSWTGDARGRWDGDTLVIDTTNFLAQAAFRGATEKLHIVERFTRVGENTLAYEVTLEDPDTWTKPWTFMIPLRKSDDKIFEYACHEGNTGLAGILSGARALEKAGRAR